MSNLEAVPPVMGVNKAVHVNTRDSCAGINWDVQLRATQSDKHPVMGWLKAYKHPADPVCTRSTSPALMKMESFFLK